MLRFGVVFDRNGAETIENDAETIENEAEAIEMLVSGTAGF